MSLEKEERFRFFILVEILVFLRAEEGWIKAEEVVSLEDSGVPCICHLEKGKLYSCADFNQMDFIWSLAFGEKLRQLGILTLN